MNFFKSFFLVLCLVFSFFPVFSQEGGEAVQYGVMSLWQIDSLIQQKDYNQALKALALYILSFPEEFDAVQKRIDICIDKKQEFNDRASVLYDVMRKSAGNKNISDAEKNLLDEQKMRLIFELEQQEKNPSGETLELTKDARRTVKLFYYTNRAKNIFDEGKNLLRKDNGKNAENYVLAVKKYSEALELKTSGSDKVFDGEKEISVVYPDYIVEKVDEQVAVIKNFVISLQNDFYRCQEAVNKYCESLKNGDTAKTKNCLRTVESSFFKLFETKNFILEAGNALAALDEQAGKLNPMLKDATYITFSKWSVFGPENETGYGLADAIDSFCLSRIMYAQKNLLSLLKKSFSEMKKKNFPGLSLLTSFDSALCSTMRLEIYEYALQGKTLEEIWEKFSGNGRKLKSDSFKTSMEFVEKFTEDELRRLFGIVAKISLHENETSKENLYTLENAKFFSSQYSSILELSESPLILNQKMKISGYVRRKTNSKEKVMDEEKLLWKEEVEYFNALIFLVQNECESKLKEIWIDYVQKNEAELKLAVAEYEKLAEEILVLSSGVEEAEGNEKFIRFYPSLILEKSLLFEKSAAEKIKIARQAAENAALGMEFNRSDEVYNEAASSINLSLESLEEMKNKVSRAAVDAKTKINQSQRARNEMEMKLQETEKYLKKENYDEARRSLNMADEKYKFSLSLDEDKVFRKKYGEKITSLDNKISVGQNELVISETRQLINMAYNEYHTGNFEKSKTCLEQAQKVWEKTQYQENTEIKDLMELVNLALESSGGKEIPYSDPLYREFGSYLNNASLHYNQGKKLVENGNENEGRNLLKLAEEEVRKVQRVFPKNVEANYLTLLINQILQPEAFRNSLDEKIRVALLSKSGTEMDVKLSLGEMRQLQKIIKDKKLDGAVLELENHLAKIQQSEKVRKDREESLRLTKLSQKETSSAKKIALLDRALALDPRNTQAQKLKDSVLIKSASETIVKNYLGDADELKYRQAEIYYNDRDKENASKIIDDLALRNANVLKVRKLKQRIDSM